MVDLPTRADLYSVGRAYLVGRAKRINPAQVDVEGSDANIFVGSTSVVGDYLLKQLGFSIAAQTLDGAESEDLDRYAFDRYQLPRKGAIAARGQVRFFRTVATIGAGSIASNTRLRTLTGVEYITTTTASFAALDLEVIANVRAVEAGKSSQVGTNSIRQFVTPGSVFDGSIQVTNDLPMAGGENAEEDDDFRARIRDFWRTARRGILAAIEFGARTVPGVTSALAVETLNLIGEPTRLVELYIADSSGVANRQLADDVDVALDEYRAGGINVIIYTSLPLIVAVTLRLSFRAGVDTVALGEEVRNAVVSYVNSLPVNGPLYVGELNVVLSRFKDDGLIVDSGSVVAPVGDLVPTPGQTLRTTLDNVTVQ